MTKISAEIIADSICNSHRIMTMKVTMPRNILAEAKTHRVMKRTDDSMEIYDLPGIGFNDDEMLSRNSASSRAIPFQKMVAAVKDDPFIPIAWQKPHSGMQGTEYWTTELCSDYPELIKHSHEGETVLHYLNRIHLEARDMAVFKATQLHIAGATKQQCNRYLEPFMWCTVLVTATEWENFFHLRCPQYHWKGHVYRSKKDALNYREAISTMTDVDWLYLNKGQAEIHMMALAEAMWDAMNESKPKELQPGEWHLPYAERIDWEIATGQVMTAEQIQLIGSKYPIDAALKICTAFAAQTSYTVVGDDGVTGNYYNLIDLHNSLLVRPYTNRKGVVFGPDDPIHTSPSEHCAQAMTEEEFTRNIKGYVDGFAENDGDVGIHERYRIFDGQKTKLYNDGMFGWCHNLRGWKSYRSMIPNENRR